MPTSLILYLAPPESLPPDFLGREVQAWFLHTIRKISPKLSQTLHDSDGHKPYTVSDVFPLPVDLQSKAAGPYLVRFTGLTDEIEDLLTGPLVDDLPETMRLWDSNLHIRGYSFSSNENPWAARYSYRWIAETSQVIPAAQESEEILMEFVSPTGFRSNGQDIADPDPVHVFRGCWQKWNLFAPPELRMHDDFPHFLQDCVTARVGENYSRQRIIVARGKRGGAVGFLGTVGFLIIPTEITGEWAADLEGWTAQLRALAMYSFFCGVGHHTTIGLGQTFPNLNFRTAGR